MKLLATLALVSLLLVDVTSFGRGGGQSPPTEVEIAGTTTATTATGGVRGRRLFGRTTTPLETDGDDGARKLNTGKGYYYYPKSPKSPKYGKGKGYDYGKGTLTRSPHRTYLVLLTVLLSNRNSRVSTIPFSLRIQHKRRQGLLSQITQVRKGQRRRL